MLGCGGRESVNEIRTVAVISIGSMGAGIARQLRSLQVVTALQGRSAETRARARALGIEDVGSPAEAARRADLVLSIVPPGRALEVARAAGPASRLYADCNAISPATSRAIARVVGSGYIDAAIIGSPISPRLYAAGPLADRLRQLPLEVRTLEGEAGASALKMCYAALTKGLTALLTESLVASRQLGVWPALAAELEESQPGFRLAMDSLPKMVPKAYRWIDEMEEIAATFAACGLTPKMLQGAADVYRAVEDARPLPSRGTEELAEALSRRIAPAG
jgi:3-hydroxyisobutyrate dehydrogenase-like beta-hydroxyacid dehydrogenase